MGKIQENALSRELRILSNMKSGTVSFRSHFKYECSDWVQIVDFLLTEIRREIMFSLYCDEVYGPFPIDSSLSFEEWLSNIKKKEKGS